MPITHDMKDFNLAENTHKMVERPASIDVGNERQQKPLRLHLEFANMRIYAFQFWAFQFGE